MQQAGRKSRSYHFWLSWTCKNWLERHNKAAAYIYWKVCQHYSIEVPERWYKHNHETVTENEEFIILQIQTDRELSPNKPDKKNYSDQGPCQLVLQTYTCISTIQTKHFNESYWKALKMQRLWECGERGQRLCWLLLVCWDIREMDQNIGKIPVTSKIIEL
mgnify:CR=1 FL=1